MDVPPINVGPTHLTTPAHSFMATPPPQSGGLGFGRPKRKIWQWVILALGVILLAALVAVYLIVLEGKTAWGKQLQDKVWQQVVDTSGIEPTEGSYSFAYTDSGTFKFVPSEILTVFEPDMSPEEAASADKYSFTLDGLKLALSSDFFDNFTDLKNPKADIRGQGSLSNNGKTYTVGTDLKVQDKNGFIKYDYNEAVQSIQLFDEFLGSELDKYKGKWIKFADPEHAEDIEEFSKTLSLQGNIKNDAEQDKNPYREILRNNRPISIKSFKGFSLMNGQLVAHYRLELDKDALRRIQQEIFRQTWEQSGLEDDEIKTFFDQANDIFLDKLQMENFEVWVGLKDKKVYKTVMVSNAISVTKTADIIYQKFTSGDVVDSTLDSARQKSRDAKRVADIRQMASALELYFNDNNSYPGSKNGVPVGLIPTYISALPVSPLPAEGPCDDYHNTYWYEAPGPAPHQNYSYSFCLSADTGGLAAGNRILTSSGIDGGALSTPPSYESGDDYTKKIENTVLDALRQIPWDAQLKVEMSVKNYGIDKHIDVPADFIDPRKDDYPIPNPDDPNNPIYPEDPGPGNELP